MTPDLDHIDLTILQMLQRNARITNHEIAEATGKSVSRTFERIKRLKEAGYIQKVVALLNGKMIGRGMTVYAFVKLNAHAQTLLLQFEKEVTALEEVMEAYHMSGVCDFLLKVEVEDLEGYHNFLVHRLFTLHGIDSVKSSFVMREPATQDSRDNAHHRVPNAGGRR